MGKSRPARSHDQASRPRPRSRSAAEERESRRTADCGSGLSRRFEKKIGKTSVCWRGRVANRVANRDGTIDRSERERERERERPLHRLLRVSSVWPRMRVGLSLQFSRLGRRSVSLAPITIPPFSLYPFVCLRVLSLTPRASLPPSPSHRSTLSLSLSLSACLSPFSVRSIPSRRTFKCHQTDREVGPHVSLYRVCLKRATSATKQREPRRFRVQTGTEFRRLRSW